MIKVLVINTAGLAVGGITTNMYNYISHIDLNKFQFDVVVTDLRDDSSILSFKKIGCNIIYLCSRTHNTFKYIKELVRLVKKNKYEIIHIHGSSHTVIVELLSCFLGGNGVRIVHAHSTKCNSLFLHKLLYIPFNLLCNIRFACSKEAGRFMFSSKEFTIIHNCIDTSKFKYDESKRLKFRNQLGIKDNEILLGHVGFFSELKNQKFLVEILSILRKKSCYKLILIGDGTLKSKVEQQANSLNLSDYVLFTGNVKNVNDYLNAIDIILMPSFFEGLPLSLIEQQANGLECLVSDRVSREADKTGLLQFLPLEKGADYWANKIQKLETTFRCRRSEQAIKSVIDAGYSIDKEVQTLQRIYSRL